MTASRLASAALIATYTVLAHGQLAMAQALPANIPEASSEQLRAAYLECDRVTSTTSVGADYMSACNEVGSVLMHRDFGGDLERQLAWWRSARAAVGPDQEALLAPAPLR